ncbi:MAG: hypothetical protein HQ538_00060 [Parcubacteria group bacterium]|nr:hypothetical protein [Parcubacteria group bacterium]
MAIFEDKIGYNLQKIAKPVMKEMAIDDNSLLFYYDTRSFANQQSEPVFFSQSTNCFPPGMPQQTVDELRRRSDWQDIVYFDYNVCEEMKVSYIKNIDYHAHELQHYYQWHNFQKSYKLMKVYKDYYEKLTSNNSIPAHDFPLEYDAIYKAKEILYKLVGVQKTEEFIKNNLYENDRESTWAVSNRIDISKPYNFQNAAKEAICIHVAKLKELQKTENDPRLLEFNFDKLCTKRKINNTRQIG